MNTENTSSHVDEELEEQLVDFFGKGGTFKDLKQMSDEAMEAIYSVAYNLYQSGKYAEAQKIFQFLCFYDHFNRKYFMGLGACQQMLKQYDQALEIFAFAVMLDGSDPGAMIYMGDCHLALGDQPMAIQSYEMAMDCAGDNPKYASDKQRAQNMLENIGYY
ncbi:Chaperone protein IpgC [invertebrate metagenome]|uniref:Chaperone protein IpgC n=1 Tax=invertebrate metagenome TaxID=1711999 RepID=A0A2H9T952_9ZZZZ